MGRAILQLGIPGLFPSCTEDSGQTKLSYIDPTEVQKPWKECLELAGQNQPALWTLVAFARRWSWEPQKEETLWAIARCSQGYERAIEDLEALYQRRRDSSGLFRVAQRTLELKPDDQQASGRYALLGLLLGVNTDTLAEFARKNCEDSSTRTPDEIAAQYGVSRGGLAGRPVVAERRPSPRAV